MAFLGACLVLGFLLSLNLSGFSGTWGSLLGLGGALAGAVGGAVVGRRRFTHGLPSWGWKRRLVLIGMGLVGGFSAVLLVNRLVEIAPVERIELPVIGRDIDPRRRSSKVDYELTTLDADLSTDAQLRVGRPVWDAAVPGGCISVARHTGVLGAAWVDDVRPMPCSAPRGPHAPEVRVENGRWRWYAGPETGCRRPAGSTRVLRC
jgi:hypothetical protein